MTIRSEYIIQNMYNKFMYNISTTSISNYFNIQDKNLTIKLLPNNKKFLLSFNYTKKIKFIHFNDLPDDINKEIYSFLNPNYIHVIYEMNVSNDYPFNPPTWSLYSIDYKCNQENINIQDYYNYLIQNHNNESERQWSPAIKFEQEFLRLIVRLNHFHYLFQ
jgi:hypothetical protein